jgi:hypothetical protein
MIRLFDSVCRTVDLLLIVSASPSHGLLCFTVSAYHNLCPDGSFVFSDTVTLECDLKLMYGNCINFVKISYRPEVFTGIVDNSVNALGAMYDFE